MRSRRCNQRSGSAHKSVKSAQKSAKQTQTVIKKLISTTKSKLSAQSPTVTTPAIPSNIFKLSPTQRRNLFSVQRHQLESISLNLQTTQRNFSSTSPDTTEPTFSQTPEYDEKAAHRKKPKSAVLMADGDAIMKVFGNPLNEDPTEPIIRSILPNGIVRATGIENPRIGAYVTIHLNNGSGGWDGGEFAFAGETTSRERVQEMQRNKDISASMQPTIQPRGNRVHAEIIRITKHEVFLAVPCSPHLINVEDRVSKTLDAVPGFKVPVSIRKGKLLNGSIPDEEDRSELNLSPNDPSLSDSITPLLGSVLNAFGDQIEQVKKPVVLGDEDFEERVNFDLKKNQTVTMPYSNLVARHILRSKLKKLPHVLNSQLRRAYGVEEGQGVEDLLAGVGDEGKFDQKEKMKRAEMMEKLKKSHPEHQVEYQQLYKSMDESVTYSAEIDMSEIDSDYEADEDGDSGNGDDEEEIRNDPFLPIPTKRSKLNQILAKNKRFIENLDLPPIYRANNSSQLLTGIPALDMFNPIRKGSRMLFTSTDSADLTTFGQTVFRNTIMQASQPPPQNPNQLEAAGLGGDKNANPNITPVVSAALLGSDSNDKTTLSPESLLNANTIGIYCAVGKTAHAKDTLVKFLDPVMSKSVVIFTNDNDTPYTHTQAVKQAIALSSALRAQGKDVLVVLDDLAHHSGAVMKLNEPFNLAMGSGVTGNHHAVNSTHAQLLDSVGVLSLTPAQQHLRRQRQEKHGQDQQNDQNGNSAAFHQGDTNSLIDNTLTDTDRDIIGSSTVISLYSTYGENATPSLAVRQSHQVLDGLKSIVDRHVPFHDHLQAARFWPPIEVQPMHPVLPTISPIMRSLMQQMNSRIIESQHLYEYAQVSESLGITIDFDVEQVIEWKAKVQALLMQSPTRTFSLAEQYITAFSAAQDRILAGVEVVDIPTYRRHLVKSLYKYPTIVNLVANIVNVSTELPLKGYKRKFTNPSAIYNEEGLMVDKDGTPLPPQFQFSDDSTRQLMKEQSLQPFLDLVGTKLSPIDEFICDYSVGQMDLRAITDFTRPLFKPFQRPDGHLEQAPDSEAVVSLVQRIQKKYSYGEPTQTEHEKVIFESMLKSNTIGKYGLPIVLDELLQVIVDDAHETFLSGEWKTDAAVEAMTKLGTSGLSPDTTIKKPYDFFANDSKLQWDETSTTTMDGMRIQEEAVLEVGMAVFDASQQAIDLPVKPEQKAKDHPLNVGIGGALGMERKNPETIIMQTPSSPKWWPF